MNEKQDSIQEFSIQGMSCSACAYRIEKGLSNTPGVARAVVNFANHTAVVESSLNSLEIQGKVESIGYKAQPLRGAFSLEVQEKKEQARARTRLIWALALALPVVVLGMSHMWSDLSWGGWVEALLTAVLLLGPGRKFFSSAIALLKHKSANMDTLVALGAGISFLWSVVQILQGSMHFYFESSAAIIAFVLLGKYIEQRMTWRATESLGALLRLQPQYAARVLNANATETELVDIRFVRPGDFLMARMGERFAADGTLLEGSTEADEALVTGESLPVVKHKGDPLVAGSLNLSQAVVYRADRIGPQTRLGEIVAFVERTRLSKAPIQRLADKASAVFVPIVLLLSLLTFVGWFFLAKADLLGSLNAAISVLVVACPCALGLATPIAVAVATGRAARLGLLFRDLSALEALQAVQTLVLDKTGTLTDGRFAVSHEHRFTPQQNNRADWPDADLLSAVVELERVSQHPLAQALMQWIQSKDSAELASTPTQLVKRKEIVGEGVQADWDYAGKLRSLFVGRASAAELKLCPQQSSATWVVCRVDGEPLVAWALTDALRSDAAQLLRELRRLGVEPVLASGDHAAVVETLGRALALEALGEQSPQMKAEFVKSLQERGSKVAMLGDGVNDAPALAAADVGIAMGSGTDAAKQTAALTLKDPSLMSVMTAIRLSRATFRNIRQNLLWAFGYNVALIPLAMSGRLTPMWAAGAMAFSSLFVVLNALRLLRFENQKTE